MRKEPFILPYYGKKNDRNYILCKILLSWLFGISRLNSILFVSYFQLCMSYAPKMLLEARMLQKLRKITILLSSIASTHLYSLCYLMKPILLIMCTIAYLPFVNSSVIKVYRE